MSLVLATGCEDPPEAVPRQENQVLVSATLAFRVDRTALSGIELQYPDYFADASQVRNVEFFRLVYRTPDPSGNEVLASGLMAIPDGLTAMPALSLQHGTLLTRAEAPSVANRNGQDVGLATVMAASGIAVLQADYLGYGENADAPHPYQHAATMGSASFDMLRAGKEFLAGRGAALTDKLFLAGYSQGGDATLALQRHLERETEWPVTLSLAGGGAFDKVAVAQAIAQQTERVNLSPLFLWIIASYGEVYGYAPDWCYYLAAELGSVVERDDYFGREWFSLPLPRIPTELFSTAFREDVANNADIPFLGAARDNDLTDWVPEYPVTLIHGELDKDVPIVGAELAAERFREAGGVVSLEIVAGGDHNAAARIFSQRLVEEIARLR